MKILMLGIFVGILLFLMLQVVSAYSYDSGGTYHYHGNYLSYHYDPYSGAEIYLSLKKSNPYDYG